MTVAFRGRNGGRGRGLCRLERRRRRRRRRKRRENNNIIIIIREEEKEEEEETSSSLFLLAGYHRRRLQQGRPAMVRPMVAEGGEVRAQPPWLLPLDQGGGGRTILYHPPFFWSFHRDWPSSPAWQRPRLATTRAGGTEWESGHPDCPRSGGIEMFGDLVMDPIVDVNYGLEYLNIK